MRSSSSIPAQQTPPRKSPAISEPPSFTPHGMTTSVKSATFASAQPQEAGSLFWTPMNGSSHRISKPSSPSKTNCAVFPQPLSGPSAFLTAASHPMASAQAPQPISPASSQTIPKSGLNSPFMSRRKPASCAKMLSFQIPRSKSNTTGTPTQKPGFKNRSATSKSCSNKSHQSPLTP